MERVLLLGRGIVGKDLASLNGHCFLERALFLGNGVGPWKGHCFLERVLAQILAAALRFQVKNKDKKNAAVFSL